MVWVFVILYLYCGCGEIREGVSTCGSKEVTKSIRLGGEMGLLAGRERGERSERSGYKIFSVPEQGGGGGYCTVRKYLLRRGRRE